MPSITISENEKGECLERVSGGSFYSLKGRFPPFLNMETCSTAFGWIRANPSRPDESRGSLFVVKQCEKWGRTQDRTYAEVLPILRLPFQRNGHTIGSPSH